MGSRHVTIVAATAVILGACTTSDVLAPTRTAHEIVQEGIRVTLTVTPEVLDPPGTVTARLTYENLGIIPVELTSSYGCVSFAGVYLEEERIPFPSTRYGCTAAISSRILEPGTPLTVEWPLVVGGEDGLQVPAGTYRFVAGLNTHPGSLERTFVIR